MLLLPPVGGSLLNSVGGLAFGLGGVVFSTVPASQEYAGFVGLFRSDTLRVRRIAGDRVARERCPAEQIKTVFPLLVPSWCDHEQ